jgi:hypothetical protein
MPMPFFGGPWGEEGGEPGKASGVRAADPIPALCILRPQPSLGSDGECQDSGLYRLRQGRPGVDQPGQGGVGRNCTGFCSAFRGRVL